MSEMISFVCEWCNQNTGFKRDNRTPSKCDVCRSII